ncbi:MAG: caspase family protein [Lentisphaeraceae bacterium]|nr:caspase family protein [Lentisphaeraceae bacterium]
MKVSNFLKLLLTALIFLSSSCQSTYVSKAYKWEKVPEGIKAPVALIFPDFLKDHVLGINALEGNNSFAINLGKRLYEDLESKFRKHFVNSQFHSLEVDSKTYPRLICQEIENSLQPKSFSYKGKVTFILKMNAMSKPENLKYSFRTGKLGSSMFLQQMTGSSSSRSTEDELIKEIVGAMEPAIVRMAQAEISRNKSSIAALETGSSTPTPHHFDAKSLKGDYHALIIGNNKYSKISALKSAVNDAETIERILRREYGFITKILRDCTREQLMNALDQYRTTLGKNDKFFLYYAGHGKEDNDEGYWLPVDADPDKRSQWISNSDIKTAIKSLGAQHVLIVADSCFSGKLLREVRGLNVRVKSSPLSRIPKRFLKKARQVISSGGTEPVLDGGGENNHSVFAGAMIKALKGNHGVLEASDLSSILKKQLQWAGAQQVPEGGDIPGVGHDGGEFIFIRKQARIGQ